MSDIQSPVSLTSTLVSPTVHKFDKPDVDPRSRLTDKYPDAFTDTYGTVSCLPFVYKTGLAWPKRDGGPEAQPYLRELRPVHGHPITSSWPKILKNAKAYLKERGVRFTAVMGLGWANASDETPFCPLLVTIGVEPKTVVFEEAKTAADYIKSIILGKAGFPDIDVAIWEWTTSFLGIGPKLPSLNPLVEGAITKFKHPFASTLGLAIAPLKKAYYEGTVALYLRRGSGSNDVLALTTAHVARPPPMYPKNMGLSHKISSKHREEIVALGDMAFQVNTTWIETRIGTLHDVIVSENKKIGRLQREQADGAVDAERISRALQVAQQSVDNATDDMQQLDRLHTRVTKLMATTNKRCIGQVLHADPIGVSSDEPDGFTIDWAVIRLNEDAFDWANFKGNKVYIGTINEQAYRDLMYPNVADQAGYEYPEDGLLQIFGTVPESEIRQPTQRNAHGDPAMPVIKNGMTTGTTVGWVNGLESLVQYYEQYDIHFTSLETTIVPYGGRRGAFSDGGDSGCIILDRNGRIVALLTGGGGLTNKTDVTFATAWYALEPHIKSIFPGVHLY